MEILIAPKNHITVGEIDYGTVFELNGELYMKLDYDCNRSNETVVHLSDGVVIKLNGETMVNIINGCFVENYKIKE